MRVLQRSTKKSFLYRASRDWKMNFDLYLLIVPVIAFYILFHYRVMYGAIIAFKDYVPKLGIWGSPWVGLKHFKAFFKSPNFPVLLRNTLTISCASIIFGFPAPIILALLINELRNKAFAGVVKTCSYLPHFISLVVACAIVKSFVSNTGLIGHLVNSITGGDVSLLNNAKYFVPIYIASDLWQEVGWSSVIYLAALAGVDAELYETAEMDGAGIWVKLIHITIPSIMPTIMIMLIMRLGGVLSVGYEKIILLYNPMTYDTADVITSYVYRKGLQEFSYSFSTAVGLFNSVINFMLLLITNHLSKKYSEISLL